MPKNVECQHLSLPLGCVCSVGSFRLRWAGCCTPAESSWCLRHGGEVFATAAFVMQSRGHHPAGTWRRQLDGSYDWDNTRSD